MMHLVSKGQAWVKSALTVGIGGQGELPEPARLREADLQGTGLGYECVEPVAGFRWEVVTEVARLGTLRRWVIPTGATVDIRSLAYREK